MKTSSKTVAAGNGITGYGRVKATATFASKSVELSNADGVPMSPAEARKLAAALLSLAEKLEASDQ